ncbi:glycosyltransferase 87 family protein [Sinomonas sp. ASV322]|uniref:glycosyltransferase 87 family protein n=1 Tax=Sinomonas sp. ASV322 TaxID=3041920 RepID=UPI0027DDA2F7|nr:glycosyltransferase 87 family protein [Sinomonas sp. ASV322]MDQ4503516.1 glycosyltransferase 87 family protein [Sinomonas sp. ASV322]
MVSRAIDRSPSTGRTVLARPASARAHAALAGVGLALAALSAAVWWTVTVRDGGPVHVLVGTGLCCAAAGCAWLLLRSAERRGASERWVIAAVVLGLLAAGAAALAAPPLTSNDSARYAWDGIVQKAGISPYRDVPAADALAGLRPGWLFAGPGAASADACVAAFPTGGVPTTSVPSGTPLCTAINRPHVPTAYPPVAEAFFALVRLPLPPGVAWLAFQIAGLGLALAVALVVVRALRREGRPPSWAALWAWNPLVLLEAVNNAHVDVLSAALLLGAGLLGAGVPGAGLPSARRAASSGAFFGLAVATKLIPAVALPGMLRNRPWRFGAAALAAFVAAYVPYVAVSGPAVIGYLPGYLSEEGYASGDKSRFALPGILLPPFAALVVGLAAVLAVWVWVWARRHVLEPMTAQALAVGWTLLIVCPSYAWYALMLVPLAVLGRRPELLVVPLALEAVTATVGTDAGAPVARVAMAAAALVVLGVGLTRARSARPR